VVVLAATGVLNAWRQIGSWDALTDSDYGTWLIVKLTLLGAVLAVAGVSRWLLRQQPGGGTEGGTESSPAGRAVRRTVLTEVVGMTLVFAATAGLVNAAPPLAAAVPSVESITVVDGDRLAQIILEPPVTGGTTIHVYLSSSTGSLSQPTDITVTATLPAQSIGPLTIPVVPAGPGHVTATDANLPIAGAWTFAITARYGEFDQVTFDAELVVR
jgi:copper transport protein